MQYQTEVMLDVVITFSQEQKVYLENKFVEMCEPARSDDREAFDELCAKIPSFCEEIYQMGKDMVWPPLTPEDLKLFGGPQTETPNDCVICSVGSNIGCTLIPFFHRKYAAKSEALHKMVCDVIAEEKYDGGRHSFITFIWPKTKKTEGIDITRLFNENDVHTGINVVWALLKFRDGRFVKEVRELQERLPKDIWIVHRKKIALYLERYG